GLPCILLLCYELYASYKGSVSAEFLRLQQRRRERKEESVAVSFEEWQAIRKQNRFGLRVIAFALVFIASLLFLLSLLTTKVFWLVFRIDSVNLLCTSIPYINSRKIKLTNPHYDQIGREQRSRQDILAD